MMRLLLAVLAFLCAVAAAAQAPTPPEATVSVLNRPVAVFRAPFLGLSPAERARRTQDAIRELLARGGPGVVTVQREPQGSVVMVDGALALILTPADADPLRGETLEAATARAVERLTRVIEETREARDHSRLLRAAGFALVATVLYLLVVWLVLRVRRGLQRRSAAWVEAQAQRAPGPAVLLQPARVQEWLRWLLRGLAWLVVLASTYQWLVFVLQQFPRTRAVGEELGAFVYDLGGRIGGGIVGALPDLAVALVIFLLARGVIALLRPMFDRAERGEVHFGWLDRELARPTRRIVSLGIWLFAIVMAYPYLPGSQTEAFKGMSVLLGVMITLGGSNLVGQAASGLILIYSRTLRVGEYVRIDSHEGTVVEMGAFTTRIRTGKGDEVTLPNALVMNTVTSNFSRAVKGQGYIVDTVVTIGYDTPWRQVESLLLEAARRTPGVLADPQPRVLQQALSDFYVEYRLVCQAVPETPRARAEVLNALHANVLDAFNEQGVQIMSPHYYSDPPDAKVVPPGHPFGAPAPRKG